MLWNLLNSHKYSPTAALNSSRQSVFLIQSCQDVSWRRHIQYIHFPTCSLVLTGAAVFYAAPKRPDTVCCNESVSMGPKEPLLNKASPTIVRLNKQTVVQDDPNLLSLLWKKGYWSVISRKYLLFKTLIAWFPALLKMSGTRENDHLFLYQRVLNDL